MKPHRKLLALVALLFLGVTAAHAGHVMTLTDSGVTAVDVAITEGKSFTVSIGGTTNAADWNSATIDLQVKCGNEWFTLPDFDDVAAAKAIFIEMAPGTQWRFNVTGDPVSLTVNLVGI